MPVSRRTWLVSRGRGDWLLSPAGTVRTNPVRRASVRARIIDRRVRGDFVFIRAFFVFKIQFFIQFIKFVGFWKDACLDSGRHPLPRRYLLRISLLRVLVLVTEWPDCIDFSRVIVRDWVTRLGPAFFVCWMRLPPSVLVIVRSLVITVVR